MTTGGTDERARRWSRLHHGIDPSGVPLLPAWLALMWRLAGPPVRWGIPPTAVTAAGLLLAGGSVAAAGAVPALAACLVVAAAVCDGLDGAVAVVGDRATRVGARADAVADRIADAAFAAVLWRCGAPWPLAVAAGALAVGVDAVRRVRRVPDRITVAERPSWAVCAALACVSAAVSDARWPQLVCAGVWVALAGIGLGQVATAPRRRADGPSSAACRGGAR
ncbi:MAG TPA: CDP-alcohol phosphatidyltransferase family protein [Jatrophihabitans sp.]|nr:CDP-alcohol phosphatidyltransferase family protein [Jatrophihabitans sp.]